MSENYDEFGDIIGRETGIFNGESAAIAPALQDFDRATTTPMLEGVKVELHCHPIEGQGMGCGSTRQLMLEYPELVAIAMGISPHMAFTQQDARMCGIQELVRWSHNPKTGQWWPDKRCACGTPLRAFITSDEAAAHLKRAGAAGWISPQGTAQVRNLVAQRIAQIQGGGAPR